MDAFYVLSKVIAFLGSLATMTVLIVLGFPYWAIFPAVLSTLTGLSVVFASESLTDDTD